MKKILVMLAVLVCMPASGMAYNPGMRVQKVGCCLNKHQVRNAIYSALRQNNWYIHDETDNSFMTTIRCNYEDIDVLFKYTDQEYSIGSDERDATANYVYCIDKTIQPINDKIHRNIKRSNQRTVRKR